MDDKERIAQLEAGGKTLAERVVKAEKANEYSAKLCLQFMRALYEIAHHTSNDYIVLKQAAKEALTTSHFKP